MNPSTPSPLPLAARAAANAGQLIAAIKLTREATGMGLAEAKAAVEAYRAGQAAPRAHPSRPGDMPVAALSALQRGEMIEAVRAVRLAYGIGLKDAADHVRAWLAEHPDAHEAVRRRNAELRRRLWQRLLVIAAIVGVLIYALHTR